MTEPFLILHKVRGEPAFDVAIRLEDDSEGECWIIPTSGHRAYPLLWWDMGLIRCVDGYHPPDLTEVNALDGFDRLPDHYSCNDRPLREDTYTVKARAASLLEGLGLVKKVKVERRI